MTPLISLIIPCYNVASICDRFFASLLAQSYSNIQLILVNDGSTDKTEEKLRSLIPSLKEKGFFVKYVTQQNKGLGGAINTGLKYIKGDYFCWADPDDYFEPNAFEVRVKYVTEHPDCAALTCDAYCRNEDDIEHYTSLVSAHFPRSDEPKQFELLLNYDSIFCPGCHMLKTEAFRAVNPQMEIYEARRGQNWQLLLPVYYAYDRHFFPIPVYNYISYQNSMSHAVAGYEEKLARIDENEEIQVQTLQRMNIPEQEREKYLRQCHMLTTKLRMYNARAYDRKDEFTRFFTEARKGKALELKDWLRAILFYLLGKK